MTNFILGALPWVAFGITVALVLTELRNKNISKEDTKEEYGENTSIGMSLGMILGIAIGYVFMDKFGKIAITYGICFGMLIGKLAEMYVKKK